MATIGTAVVHRPAGRQRQQARVTTAPAARSTMFDLVWQVWQTGSLSTYWPVTARSAMSVAALYRGVAIYGDQIGSMPVDVYLDRVNEEPLPPFVRAPAGVPVGWGDEIRQAITSILLRGNAYCHPTGWDWQGFPATFEVWNPDEVAFEYREGRAGYRCPDESWVRYPADPLELLHIRGGVIGPGARLGLGVLDALGATTIAVAASTERFTAGVFDRGPIPPAALVVPQTLTEVQKTDLKNRFVTSLQEGNGAPVVLSGGVDIKNLGVIAEQLQLLEQRRWNATAMAVALGLPAFLVGGSTGDSLTYNSVPAMMQQLYNLSLRPVATTLEQHFQAWLPGARQLRFNFDVALRPETYQRYQAHQIALDPVTGWMTKDEVRDIEDLPPLELPPSAPAPVAPPVPGVG